MDSLIVGDQKSGFSRFLPWILSIIFFILSLIFIILYAVNKPKSYKPDPSHYIPIVQSVFDDSKQEGSYKRQGNIDVLDTKYFQNLDIYNLKSKETLSIISNFHTYQQTSRFSCGCASLIMSAFHKGKKDISERECVEFSHTIPDIGMNPLDMEKTLEHYGLEYESKRSFTEEKLPTKDLATWEKYVKEAVDAGDPIIMLSYDYGGHYTVIIGLDTAGKDEMNHTFFIADPYDTCDHIQDGYSIISADRFFCLWKTDYTLFPDTVFNAEFFRVKGLKSK